MRCAHFDVLKCMNALVSLILPDLYSLHDKTSTNIFSIAMPQQQQIIEVMFLFISKKRLQFIAQFLNFVCTYMIEESISTVS